MEIMKNWKSKALFLQTTVPSIELAWASSTYAYRFNGGYARDIMLSTGSGKTKVCISLH